MKKKFEAPATVPMLLNMDHAVCITSVEGYGEKSGSYDEDSD